MEFETMRQFIQVERRLVKRHQGPLEKLEPVGSLIALQVLHMEEAADPRAQIGCSFFVRVFTQCDLNLALFLTSEDGQRDFVAGLAFSDGIGQRLWTRNGLTVNGRDHLTAL